MLRLNGSGLVVQTFELCLHLWDAFAETGSDYWSSGRTNICHFVRTVIVAGPLALLATIWLYGFMIYVGIVYPVLRFGGTIYTITIGSAVAIILLAVGITHLIRLLERNKPARAPKPKKERKPGFVNEAATVFWTWLISAKQRVCPLIETRTPEATS